MVFQINEAALLDNLKTGDKIKFKMEQTGGAMVVTEIQPVK
jgi:Cu(I)/Ag(I) efflux system periplasmic protein CusF